MKRKLSRSAFVKKVKDTVKQHDMLHPGDRVLVAVSGGPDSVCLLRVFMEVKRNLKIEIIVANLDHGIRGRESKRDSDFVKELSKDFGLDCMHKKISIRTRKKGKRSLEECAREERYAFLKKSAEKCNCNVIATGHTMDDQAETVLLRLITGASLKGIAGIPVVRHEGSLKIIRPLITAEKKEILDYLKVTGQAFCEDHTNMDKKYFRNRIRHEVLPFLEEYNPRIKRSVANLCNTMREDLDFLEREKQKLLSRYSGTTKGPVRVEVSDLILQPKALRKEVFKELFSQAGGNIKKLTYRHWKDMDYLIRAGASGKSLNFPGGVRVTRLKTEIVFLRRFI